MSHIEPTPLPDEEILPVFLGDDPDLALVHADMSAWADAHPCRCTDDDGVCRCEEETA